MRLLDSTFRRAWKVQLNGLVSAHLHPGAWRNGRRRGLKNLGRKACGFEPHRPYQAFLAPGPVALPLPCRLRGLEPARARASSEREAHPPPSVARPSASVSSSRASRLPNGLAPVCGGLPVVHAKWADNTRASTSNPALCGPRAGFGAFYECTTRLSSQRKVVSFGRWPVGRAVIPRLISLAKVVTSPGRGPRRSAGRRQTRRTGPWPRQRSRAYPQRWGRPHARPARPPCSFRA